MKNKITRLFIILSFICGFSTVQFGQGVAIGETPANADASALLDLQSENKGFLLPRLTNDQRNGISNPATGLMIYNLDTDCPEFFDGTDWKNLCTGSEGHKCIVGEQGPAGGIIFFCFGDYNGLEAAAEDQSNSIIWGCSGTLIGTAENLGAGWFNTINIEDGCADAEFAAKLCRETDINGFADWYLPSIDQLEEMYTQKDVIGGFSSDGYYWSSTEAHATGAKMLAFGSYFAANGGKSNPYNVRCIRSF